MTHRKYSRKYSLTFKFREQPLRLTIYRLFRLFGWSIALTRTESTEPPMAMQPKVPQTSETKNGNLNQAEQGEPLVGEGVRGAKSNDCEATLRKGSLPAASAVTTVDRDKNKGAAIRAAQRQNTSDEKTWPHGRNVIPQSHDNSVLTHDIGGE
jgi:hypothetical protein